MKIFTIIMTALLTMASAVSGSAGMPETIQREIYADCGAILEEPTENVVITMQNGNQFSFENSDGDWMKGDLVSVIFDSNETEEVFDDIIISYRYSGWISENEQKTWIK